MREPEPAGLHDQFPTLLAALEPSRVIMCGVMRITWLARRHVRGQYVVIRKQPR